MIQLRTVLDVADNSGAKKSNVLRFSVDLGEDMPELGI